MTKKPWIAQFLLTLILFSGALLANPQKDNTALDSSAIQNQNELLPKSTGKDLVVSPDFFQAVGGKGKEGYAEISWVLDYDKIEFLREKKVIIRYITSIDAKRVKSGMQGKWHYSEPIPATNVKYTIEGLDGNEKYEFYVGLPEKGDVPVIDEENANVVWSDKIKVKTERKWGILKFLILFGSLGLFIFGMKVMSDGLQRASGPKLRQMLGSITSNRVKGVFTGFASTAIVQSSSVTTVMTVSLVNAGLLNLRQSAGVMMGANIGTTITAWLVLLLGFKVSISSYALMLIALGIPFIFMTFPRAKEIANSIIGFAILFIGLQFLKDAVPDLDKDSALVKFFIDFKDIPVLSNIMFVALGALVTIVVQSSSAAMALTLTMVSKGIIPYEVACAMILGENIGTTITAELASMIGNVHAKRSARIHSLFNVVGVTWMLIVFPWFTDLVGFFIGGSSFNAADTEMANSGIALFHTLFNLANVLVMIWFVPQLVRTVERTVKSKSDEDEEFKLDYIGGNVVSAPGLALMEAKKEVAKFGNTTSRMSEFARTILNNPSKKKRVKMMEKIAKYEEITDRVEVEIAQFLEKVSVTEMSVKNSLEVRSMLSITNDLERIGDIFFQMSKTFERKNDKKVYFEPEQRDNLNKMFDFVDRAFNVMNANLSSEYGSITIEKAISIEKEINELRTSLKKAYLKKIEKGDENIRGSIVYNDIFSQLEKIGDHVINVSEAVQGKI
tara:strand:+ start:3109 stop:5295 length:2187 start_codon:yes stop_codon:yes gene_type:complete